MNPKGDALWQRTIPGHYEDPLAVSGYLDEMIDLLDSPIWKILAFRINGWPRLPIDPSAQSWRPWHRWVGRRDRRRRRL